MRDQRFVAEHRGGLLKRGLHDQLVKWAAECSEHVLPLLGETVDPRLNKALSLAHKWGAGNVSVWEARAASVAAHAVARESSDPTVIAVARSAGHAVAAAHMADHSLRAALYALNAVEKAGRSIDAEWKWQQAQLPSEISELVVSAMRLKGIWG